MANFSHKTEKQRYLVREEKRMWLILTRAGNVNTKLRTFTFMAVNFYATAMAGNDGVGNRESQSGALALGRVEGLEDQRQTISGNPLTAIADRHAQAFILALCRHPQVTTIRHGIHCICKQIQNRLLQPIFVHVRVLQRLRDRLMQDNLLLLELLAHQKKRVAKNRRQISWSQPGIRQRSKIQKLINKTLQAFDLLQGALDQPLIVRA